MSSLTFVSADSSRDGCTIASCFIKLPKPQKLTARGFVGLSRLRVENLRARMEGFMDCLQPRVIDVSVDLRRGDAGVPQ